MLFYHPELDVSMAVHGDDFTLCGLEADLWKVKKWMDEWFEVKVRGVLGGSDRSQTEVTILGRTVEWTPRGLNTELTTNIAICF